MKGAVSLLEGLPDATPDAIRQARGDMSQAAAGALIGRTAHDWYRYESGARGMDRVTWALVLLALGLHPAYSLKRAR